MTKLLYVCPHCKCITLDSPCEKCKLEFNAIKPKRRGILTEKGFIPAEEE